MRKLILLIVFCCSIVSHTALSQNRDNLLSILDSKLQEYNKKRILSDIKIDIDGDGITDYFAIYCEPIKVGKEDIMETMLVCLLSKNNYEEEICQNFLPSQKIIESKNSGINDYLISSVDFSKRELKS